MLSGKLQSATAGAPANYIEDVFSTYLFTGNGTTQTVTNGIDLAGKGGMVWRKQRDAVANHFIADTVRGTYSTLSSNTSAVASGASYIDFLSDGFQAVNSSSSNPSDALQVSWTFRKQPKFFDVVTWTGNSFNRTIAHNLKSAPATIIVKNLTSGTDWIVYHTSTGATQYLILNTTATPVTSSAMWNNTAPTSTVFSLGTDFRVNNDTNQFVAYLFAHNAGGFGTAGTDNVVSCGSFTGNGSSTVSVNLGYEPQWIMFKSTNASAGNYQWMMFDSMRGFPTSGQNASYLKANTADAEGINWPYVGVNATGFQVDNAVAATGNFIYIAIRRPMKVPTDGTKVFAPVARTGTGSVTSVTTPGFPVDMVMIDNRLGYRTLFFDKLRGANRYITSVNTAAEATYSGNNGVQGFLNTGVILGADTDGYVNFSGDAYINWNFQRAPGFFDVVCYTGNGATQNVAHNLAAVPELMIMKGRSSANNWIVYNASLGNTKALILNGNNVPITTSSWWNNTSPTTSVFSLGGSDAGNLSGATQVAYLFATCPGVSKVTNFTGNGSSQTINCGFTSGARFVMIKRTDSTGDWYVWDSARGIVAGNDPHLSLNTTAAEVTSDDTIDPDSTGFIVNQVAATNCNVNGASYIVLAIA